MTKAEYLEENEDYAEDDQLAVLEHITEEIWPSIEAAGMDPGYSMAITHETLEDFDNSRRDHWSDKGGRKESDFAGRPGRQYTNMQAVKGKRRENLAVVDCGDFRVAIRS